MLGNRLHTPHKHSSALLGTDVGETLPEEHKKTVRFQTAANVFHCPPFKLLHCTCRTAGGTLQLCISSLM